MRIVSKLRYSRKDLFGYSVFTHDFRKRRTLLYVYTISFGMNELSIANLSSRIDLLSEQQFVSEVYDCVITLPKPKK